MQGAMWRSRALPWAKAGPTTHPIWLAGWLAGWLVGTHAGRPLSLSKISSQAGRGAGCCRPTLRLGVTAAAIVWWVAGARHLDSHSHNHSHRHTLNHILILYSCSCSYHITSHTIKRLCKSKSQLSTAQQNTLRATFGLGGRFSPFPPTTHHHPMAALIPVVELSSRPFTLARTITDTATIQDLHGL